MKCEKCGKETTSAIWVKDEYVCDECIKKEFQESFLSEKSDFIKSDAGKLEWSLLPFKELEDTVRILMFGAKKYSVDNWKKCDNPKRYEDALMRHIVEYMKGNKTDEESGKSHLAHAICNCLFLQYFDNQEGKE